MDDFSAALRSLATANPSKRRDGNLRDGAEMSYVAIGEAIGKSDNATFLIYQKAIKNFKRELARRGLTIDDLLE